MTPKPQPNSESKPSYTAEMERAEKLIDLRKTARMRMAQARECMTRADNRYKDREYYLWETIRHMLEAVEALTCVLEMKETSDA